MVLVRRFIQVPVGLKHMNIHPGLPLPLLRWVAHGANAPKCVRSKKDTRQMFPVPQQPCDLRIADHFTKKSARLIIFPPYLTVYLLNPA